MCEHDEPVKGVPDDGVGPNAFCLKAEHLLLAWRTCASKADAAVSDEIYHLLVSILVHRFQISMQYRLSGLWRTLWMLQKVAHCLKLPSFVVHLQHEQTWTPKQGNLVCTTFTRKWSALRYLCFSGLCWPTQMRPLWKTTRFWSSMLPTYWPIGSIVSWNIPWIVHKIAGIEYGTIGRRYTRGRVFRFVNGAIDRFCVGSVPTWSGVGQGRLASLLFNELTAYLSRHKADVKSPPIPKRVSVEPTLPCI